MKNYDENKLKNHEACFWAFQRSRDAGNELIDFGMCVFNADVPKICETLHSAGVEEFTISTDFSGLVCLLFLFEENGYKIAGMTKVRSEYKDFETGERELIPAILMKEER